MSLTTAEAMSSLQIAEEDASKSVIQPATARTEAQEQPEAMKNEFPNYVS